MLYKTRVYPSVYTQTSLFSCMLYNSLKRSILHNDLVSWTGHCRFSTKTCVSSCPFLSAIFFFLPQFAATSHTLVAQRALCPEQRWRPLCLCARGLDLSRTIRIHFFKRQKQLHRKLHGCHPESVISVNYSPCSPARVKVRALNQMVNSQRPVEVQQFNGRCWRERGWWVPCSLVVKHLTQAGLPRSALSPTPP